jgi:hypothetical protein
MYQNTLSLVVLLAAAAAARASLTTCSVFVVNSAKLRAISVCDIGLRVG